MPKGMSGGKSKGGGITLEGVSIQPSKIAGKGAFADHQVRKGDDLGIAFIKQNDTGVPDIDYTTTTLGRYVNHSKNPNVKLVKLNEREFEFKAIKHVRKGQELRVDYDQIEKVVGFKGKPIPQYFYHYVSKDITLQNKTVDPREVSHSRFVQKEHQKSLRRIQKQLGVTLDIPLEVRENPSIYTDGTTIPITSKYTGGQGSAATRAPKPFSTIGTRQQIIDSVKLIRKETGDINTRVGVQSGSKYVVQHENLHHYYHTLSNYQKQKITKILIDENLTSDYGDRREEQNVDILTNILLPKQYSKYKQMSKKDKLRILKKINSSTP